MLSLLLSIWFLPQIAPHLNFGRRWTILFAIPSSIHCSVDLEVGRILFEMFKFSGTESYLLQSPSQLVYAFADESLDPPLCVGYEV